MTDRTESASVPTGKAQGRKSIRISAAPRELMTDTPELARAWSAQVITLFPEAFPGVLGESLTGRALKDGIWQLRTHDLRQFGIGRHRNVDDTPAGGGAGMVLRADVVGPAIEAAVAAARGSTPVIYLSPRGRPFSQAIAHQLSRADGAILLCGRFEGVDQRVLDHYGVEEISIGDYVLTGGEIAAQAVLDATVRLLPGVLGNAGSLDDESHSNGLLEHPQFTKPSEWKGRDIPPVLLSGNHAEIARWRAAESEALTRSRRPDMWLARHHKRSGQTD